MVALAQLADAALVRDQLPALSARKGALDVNGNGPDEAWSARWVRKAS